jgi:membrane fusion protein (multidrug efflux system)
MPVTAIYVAQTQSSQAVNIQARASGWPDKRMFEGSVVKAGQVLFQMDQKPFQAQLDGQQAALQRNQAALQVATQNLARTKPLAEQNALSQKDLDDAQGQYQQAAAAVEQGKAQVETAQLNLSYTTIRSPVDGVSSYAIVADGRTEPGQLQPRPLVLTPMWINLASPERDGGIRNDVRSGCLLPDGGKFIVEVEMVDAISFHIMARSRSRIRLTTWTTHFPVARRSTIPSRAAAESVSGRPRGRSAQRDRGSQRACSRARRHFVWG